MQETLDEIIDELNNDIIPAGEDLLREVTEVETVEEDQEENEPEDTTEDPVERLIRPHRERNEPGSTKNEAFVRAHNEAKSRA